MADEHTLGDRPIQPEYYEQMRTVAAALDDLFNGPLKHPDKQVGFVLLVFPFGEKEGRCNYISNGASRRDVVALLREQAARFEGSASDDTGHG